MNIFVGIIFLVMSFLCGLVDAAVSQKIQETHKEVSDKLIALRKEHPQTQQHVYAVLDQVGKLHRQAQEVCTANSALEQELKTKDEAYKAVTDELTSLKNKFLQARNELKQMGEKFAAHQAEVQKEEQQKKEKEQQKKEVEQQEIKEEKDAIVALTSAESELKNKLLSRIQKKNELFYQKNS